MPSSSVTEAHTPDRRCHTVESPPFLVIVTAVCSKSRRKNAKDARFSGPAALAPNLHFDAPSP